jgi:hypothetical protein
MADDQELLALLRVVAAGDDANELANNSILSKQLGWDLEKVAACLQDAKDRSLLWGQRNGDKPAPWFNDLEITVQGRRFLRTTDAAAAAKPVKAVKSVKVAKAN